MRRIFVFAPVLLIVFAASVHAGEKPDSCALQKQAWQDAIGGTEQAKAAEVWRACTVWAKDQQKMELAETRNTWAASLDKLPNGGWEFLMVSPDGAYAIFGSHRHATREGSVVSLWLRYEYRESQTLDGSTSYKSVVYRDMNDCAGVRSKFIASTFYGENNLGGSGTSYTHDDGKVAWAPVIPGTVGDSLLDWACKTTPRSQAAKAP
jgi:hypothetical protein